MPVLHRSFVGKSFYIVELKRHFSYEHHDIMHSYRPSTMSIREMHVASSRRALDERSPI